METMEVFIKNLSLSSKKYGFGIRDPKSGIRNPGSGINLFWIPDPGPGVNKAPGPRSGCATLLVPKFSL
jgi:hypothetical protein